MLVLLQARIGTVGMANLLDELSDDQKLMIETIYLSFANKGEWPNWQHIKRRFRQQSDLDPKEVRDSFPVVGRRGGPGPSYSVIHYSPHDLGDSAVYKLCIAAGLHVQKYERTASKLVEVIQYFAKGMKSVDPDAGDIKFTRDRLARVLNWDPYVTLKIPDFLHHEPMSLILGSSTPEDGNWEVALGDEGLVPYSDISTIQEYVEKTTELITTMIKSQETAGMHGSTSKALDTQSPMTVVGGPSTYVNQGLIDQLEGLQPKGLHLGKLKAMLRELNAVYTAEQPYASLMLCRAIMDHVPPIFGFNTFANVVSQVNGQTDRKHLMLLRDNRFVSDDALHRPISKHADILELQDVPNRQAINTLVRLIIDALDQD